MVVVPAWEPAIREALARTPRGDEFVVLATYTATLALRAALARLGYARPFWED